MAWELLSHDVTKNALRCVVTLGMPDLLTSAPRAIPQLAADLGVDQDALRRIVRHLVAVGIFDAPRPDFVALNSVSRSQLISSEPFGLAPELHEESVAPKLEAALANMGYTLRTGKAAYEFTHGESLWQQMAKSDRLTDSFDRRMELHARDLGPALAQRYPWHEVRHLVDVGGGTGALLRVLLDALPHLRGTLVEFATAAERAARQVADRKLAARFQVVEGSFFDPLPTGADAYLLSWILHDWPDREAIQILRGCREAGGANGRVLVLEKTGSRGVDTDLDLRMMVFFGGRERLISDYARLGTSSGLRLTDSIALTSGFQLLEFRPL
jgi:hypothetical protein